MFIRQPCPWVRTSYLRPHRECDGLPLPTGVRGEEFPGKVLISNQYESRDRAQFGFCLQLASCGRAEDGREEMEGTSSGGGGGA